MKCDKCNRDNMSARELSIHLKYFVHTQQHLEAPSAQQPLRVVKGMCPGCGGTLFYQEGCAKCMSCGYNKCEGD